jgi:hypothetical protein
MGPFLAPQDLYETLAPANISAETSKSQASQVKRAAPQRRAGAIAGRRAHRRRSSLAAGAALIEALRDVHRWTRPRADSAIAGSRRDFGRF